MKQIRSTEFFIGGYISSILNSAKGAPAPFDETNDSKRSRLETVLGNFDIYIKYTGKSSSVSEGKRTKTSWFVSFTKEDMDELNDEFECKGYKSYLVLVLSIDKLSDAKIAIINYADAMKCLDNVAPSSDRGINVLRYGSEHNFICYGAAQKENDGFLVPVTFVR